MTPPCPLTKRVTGVNTTERTDDATLIRDVLPHSRNAADGRSDHYLPGADPRRFIEPRETETRTMHALEEYGVMQVKLYEDIARFGHIATTYAYPVKVNGRDRRRTCRRSRIDNPKMGMMPARNRSAQGAKSASMWCRRLPAWKVSISTITRSPFSSGMSRAPLAVSTHSYLDEVVLDDAGNRMFVCSDTDYCRQQSEAKANESTVTFGQ